MGKPVANFDAVMVMDGDGLHCSGALDAVAAFALLNETTTIGELVSFARLILIVIAASVGFTPARAADTPPPSSAPAIGKAATEPTPPNASAPSTSAAPARTKLLVLEPKSTVVDLSTRKTLAGLIGVELTKQPVLDVLMAADVERLVELEGQRQMLGCEAESCIGELAYAMGARYVVYGDIGQLGATVVFHLNLFDSETATAVNRILVQGSLEQVGAELPAATRTLVGPLVTRLGGTNAVDRASATATTTTAATTTVGGAGWTASTIAVTAVGALVFVASGAYDLFAPSSANGELDAGDAVGPVGIIVGLGVVSAGVLLSSTSGGAP